MPSESGGGTASAGPTAGASDDSTITSQLNSLVPTFDPSTDDVNIWSGKVELLLSAWPKQRVSELATRLILGCKGSVFLKLQLHRDAICINDPKGIRKLVEIVGGSWGQIPLERKYEIAEKAIYKCIQKSDETSDSFLTRCDVVWTELMARNVKIEELQAYIMLRGSRLSADDKKRVLIDSGAESGGTLNMDRVTAAVRMLGAGFFQEMTGQKKEKSLKVYDNSAFVMDEEDEAGDQEVFVMDDQWEDDQLETLAAENDDDAALVIQFEDAVMETIQNDNELSTYFASYQDARRRLAEKGRVRGFWPIRRSADKGKKGAKGKSKGKNQSLASRIANSYCRICFKRGHWKDECPNNPSNKSGATSSSSAQIPTSFVVASEIPPEIAHLPHASGVTSFMWEEVFFGEVVARGKNKNHGKQGEVFKHKLAEGLKHHLRNMHHREDITHDPRVRDDRKPRTREVDCQVMRSEDDSSVQHSYFASSGTIGVVDLGASQTVIGSQQIPELLEKLPSEIRSRVKRTDCNLVFRFGNHQTLNSHHAILLPVLDTWFRIAIVKGNTPFLLSSDFLRKTIQAVIDTEAGTIWSKKLQKKIEVDITPKNLFLMDITQLWSNDPGQAQPVLTSQVQPVEELECHVGRENKAANSETDREHAETNQSSCVWMTIDKQNQHKEPNHTPVVAAESVLKSEVQATGDDVEKLGSKIETRECVKRSPVPNSCHVSVAAPEILPKGDDHEQRGGRAGDNPVDVIEGSEPREGSFWDGTAGKGISRSLSRSCLGRLVCSQLREVDQTQSQEIRPLCGTSPECRSRGGSKGVDIYQSEANTAECQAQDDSHQIESTAQGSGCDILDSSDTRRDRPGRCHSHDSTGGRGESTSGRTTTSSCSTGWIGERNAGGDQPSETDASQDGAVSDVVNALQASQVDLDFEFVAEHERKSMTTECKRLIRQFEKELGEVYAHHQLFRHYESRIDMLEVMCSAQSEITKQTNQLGGQSVRFGLAEGDLQQIENRRNLFHVLVKRKPRNVWMSPVCAPWCAWSHLNCSKSEELLVKIMENRKQNLWQLALAVVLFRFQQASSRHFHLEQPFGSLMLLFPCLQEIIDQTSRCCFDMCRMGALQNPNNAQFIRKRLVVQTTSNALHRLLDGKTCNSDHFHQHIAGSIRTPNGNMALSKYTEKYPQKFARQVVRTLLQEKSWENPIYVGEDEDPHSEHPTKKRRLGSKKSPAEIDQLFRSVNWQKALKMADELAPRVGILVVHHGDLMKCIEQLNPKYNIHHLVLCRGTDRYVGPSQTMSPGVAPLRKRACIRRRFEDIQVDDEWEAWERLTLKGMRRKGTAARVSLTVFASLKVDSSSQMYPLGNFLYKMGDVRRFTNCHFVRKKLKNQNTGEYWGNALESSYS